MKININHSCVATSKPHFFVLQFSSHKLLPHRDVYKRQVYADEPLNPRIANPVLQGNSLIAVIDKVPCSIQLTDNVVDAHRSGALPLNTLANAVLAKHDEMQQMAQQNYRAAEAERDEGRERTILLK